MATKLNLHAAVNDALLIELENLCTRLAPDGWSRDQVIGTCLRWGAERFALTASGQRAQLAPPLNGSDAAAAHD